MKSKLFKYMILASSLVFMNCGDDTKESLTNAVGDTNLPKDGQQLIPQLDENGNPVFDENGNPVMIPDTTSLLSDFIPLLDENGNPVFDENGNQVMIQNPATWEDPEDNLKIGGSDENMTQDPVSSNSVVPASSAAVVMSSASVDPASSASVEPVVVEPASSASVEPVVVEPASSASVEPVVSSSSVEVKKGIFLAPGTEEEKNQLEVEYKQDIGYGAKGNGILAYPKQLSTTQKHGIVIWGPGGGTEPGAYEGMIRRLASHGFVVFALNESPGSGDNAKKALDFLAKKNETPDDELFGKLDMNVAGCSGHSMGGLESEQAVIKDSRVQTAFLNNSGDLGHAAAASVSTSKSIAILYGEGGMERPNAVADYRNNGVKAPACLIKMQGGQGNECASDDWDRTTECGWGHGSGSWGGMAATVAWMRWHLGGEDFRKADFVGTSGKYVNGNIINERGSWKTECKNF